MTSPALLVKRALPFALALGIWFAPVPAGLTAPAWHLFAIFVASMIACTCPKLSASALPSVSARISNAASPCVGGGAL